VTIHNEYAQENPRINRQDRQKIMFHGSAYPKEISQQCTPATHTEAVHCQRVFLGVFHPCLWPLKAPGSSLGEGFKNLSSARWRQYPRLVAMIPRAKKDRVIFHNKTTITAFCFCLTRLFFYRKLQCHFLTVPVLSGTTSTTVLPHGISPQQPKHQCSMHILNDGLSEFPTSDILKYSLTYYSPAP